MYRKNSHSWLKHLDFFIFDIIILTATYIGVILVRHHGNLGLNMTSLYTRLGVILLVLYLLVSIVGKNYNSILQRNKWQECFKVFIQILITFLLLVVYMFVTKQSALFSRVVFGLTAIFAFVFISVVRVLYKHFLRMRLRKSNILPELLIVTDREHLDSCLKSMVQKTYNAFRVKGIALLGEDLTGQEINLKDENTEKVYKVLASDKNIKEYVLTEVVDEVLLEVSDKSVEQELTEYLLETGITVHIAITDTGSDLPNAMVEEIGRITTLTTSVNIESPWKFVVKRIIDIIGGIVGCIIVGILFVILAPQIKAKDKGSVFFKQLRIGKNGRQFYMYKFRSMYMDAEERKKELMDRNEMEGLMFKIENDPRILPGVGHKIRKWSLDEFPQFVNVLKGDMSLVGTRPPTVEEFSHYEAHHKMRLSFKPGITGLWQVSGRNDITDFEKVVALDNEYIKNWSLGLDFKIIFKTFKVVVKRVGSK